MIVEYGLPSILIEVATRCCCPAWCQGGRSRYIGSKSRRAMDERMLLVVIVGGGFGGLAAAKALRKTPVQIVLIDRTNHHLFQPLLYQVATSLLGPGQIGSPI